MKLVDANLLLYAINEDAPLHRKARVWLESALMSNDLVAFTWPVLLAVIRLSTKSIVFPRPLTLQQALDFVDTCLDQPSSTILQPGPRHWAILKNLLVASGKAGDLSSDAHLAAMAIEHGALLVTTDNDFARFDGLRWDNPLIHA